MLCMLKCNRLIVWVYYAHLCMNVTHLLPVHIGLEKQDFIPFNREIADKLLSILTLSSFGGSKIIYTL